MEDWDKAERMKDFQLYHQILGLTAPWRVERVTLKTTAREVEVRVTFDDTLWACPECQGRMQIHDYEERRWRHLDRCQLQTNIEDGWMGLAFIETCVKSSAKNGAWTAMPKKI